MKKFSVTLDDVTVTPGKARPVKRRAAKRSQVVSLDFDRTFAAAPKLWGDFARQAKAEGNTVVMVSRRPDTPDNQREMTQVIGQYADVFSRILLIGDRLKDEAAKEAGINVDVWVDDSPQFVR